jgi:phage gp36-like protein
MSYATRSDIERIYGADELRFALNFGADDPLDGDSAARIDQALVEATSQIDAFVGGRYELPLPLVPEVLKAFAVDLALYRLALRTGRPRDELRKRYEDAVSFLKSVAKGEAKLPGIDTGNAAPDALADAGSSSDVATVSRPRLFTRKTETP